MAKDARPELRQQAVLALGRIGADAAPALPQLRTAMKDADKSVRCQAVHALPAYRWSPFLAKIPTA